MATKFGFLSRLEFLQGWTSSLIASIHPAAMQTSRSAHYVFAHGMGGIIHIISGRVE